jgi:hypothetical protein
MKLTILTWLALLWATPTRASMLVAGSDELYVLRGGVVVTLDRDGRAIRRCSTLEPRQERTATRRPLALDAEDVLRLAGLPDDDTGTTEAEDLLRDEGFGRVVRRRDTQPVPEVRALAAERSANRVWIATSIGLFRGDREGCAAAALAGRDLGLVAVSGDVVVAAGDRLLWRIDLGSRTTTRVTGLTGRPRALGIAPGGWILLADDDGILEVGPGGEATRWLDRPADALAICDGTAVAVTTEGLYAWTPGNPPIRRGPRPPVRRIACGRHADARFVAAGSGVWTSGDGITWTAQRDWMGRDVRAAAATADAVWVLADDRVLRVDSGDGVRENPASGAVLAPIDTRRWVAPRFPWPEVALLFAAQQTPQRFGWAVELVVAFPLGRRGLHRADQRPLAVELVRRDGALAAAASALAATGGDEARARIGALNDERNSLR